MVFAKSSLNKKLTTRKIFQFYPVEPKMKDLDIVAGLAVYRD